MPALLATALLATTLLATTGCRELAERLDSDGHDAPTVADRPPPPPPVGSGTPTPRVAPRGPLDPTETRTIELFRNAAPSVVYITKLTVRTDLFNRDVTSIPRGSGSGFIWDDSGHIVTNFHVIQGGNAARVTLADRSTFEAQLVGAAPDKDIAVLRIAAPKAKLPPLPIGTSEDLLVGQTVLAIGNPFGLDQTLSTGVVSGIGREIQSVSGRPIQGVVQTDAAINPGNSGGPLLDTSGRLIGINTAIFSPSGAYAGIGFAVPVDTVCRIVPQLIQHGKVVQPGLGIQIAEEEVARRFRIDGVLVLGVMAGSGAETAGIRPTRRSLGTGDIVLGDVIVAVDGAPVKTSNDLYKVIDLKRVGEAVKVTVLRDGQKVEVDVTLTALE